MNSSRTKATTHLLAFLLLSTRVLDMNAQGSSREGPPSGTGPAAADQVSESGNATASAITVSASVYPVHCIGASDGAIGLFASGGTAPYDFSIDGGITWQAANDFGGLAAGTYVVMARDALSIRSSPAVVTISQPSSLRLILVFSISNCYGKPSSLSASVQGGTPPYSYRLDSQATYSSAWTWSVGTGSHIVSVKDACGGVATAAISIPERPALSLSLDTTEVTCPAGANGSITATFSGGSPPYRVSLDAGPLQAATSPITFSELLSGGHSISVTDAYGCVTKDWAQIAVSTPPADCALTGPSSVMASSSANIYTAPAGQTVYRWSISGNGTLNGSVSGQTVAVTAGGSGAFTVNLSMTNAVGCPSACMLYVQIVGDATLPTLTCPASIVVPCPGNIPAPARDLAAFMAQGGNASDDSGSVTVSFLSETFAGSSPRIITRVYQATDPSGNRQTCTQTLTVLDAAPPQIYVEAPRVQPATPGQCTALLVYAPPSVVDSSSLASLVITGPPSGSRIPIGITKITVTAVDVCGNAASATITAIVVDYEHPIFTSCPAPIITSNDPGLCGAVVRWATPAATDNCTGLTLTRTAGPASGSFFPIGTTTITYTATDASGNSTVCSFPVTVKDTQSPVITGCPAPITTGNDPGSCGAVVRWQAPAVQDNCPGTVLAQTGGPLSGGFFSAGTTTVTYTATDASGNSTVCSFPVIVKDTQSPVIIGCPAPITTGNDPGACGATVRWQAPTVQDNCPGTVLAQTGGPFSGSFFPIGTTLVTSTARDASGNVSACSFAVTVEDRTPPVLNCPVQVIASSAGGPVVVFYSADAHDECGPPTVLCVPPSGSSFQVGTTHVDCRATDTSNNSTTCGFPIAVDLALTLACPGNIVQRNDSGRCSAVVRYSSPVPSDGSVQVTCNPPSSFEFPVGTTTVQCAAVNASHTASASCSFLVSVTDTEPPVIQSVTAVPNLLKAPHNQAMVPVQLQVLASDNCRLASTRIISVTSTDPASGLARDDKSPDWQVTGDLTLNLRNESFKTKGRTYTITVQCQDTAGYARTAAATVTVTK